nr:zinc finger, RING/FYVE/PHD-type [Tanacetum cinerariifolium]GEY32694.1 zinc finger, RING/FYVE/PHD-type [Tanacetum cinerariifolium]
MSSRYLRRPRENSTNGIERVFSVRLGKFKSFNEGERSNGGDISRCNLDARRYFSMGLFRYVLNNVGLPVALLNVEDDVGCGRTKDVMDGRKIKYDSFLVSKVEYEHAVMNLDTSMSSCCHHREYLQGFEAVLAVLITEASQSRQHGMSDPFMTGSTAEPKNIKEAMADSAWIEAMQEELHQFDKLQVWELVNKPFGKSIIKLKWLLKNKKDEDETVIRNKARLVAKGYAQEEGIDFEESFAPVARLELHAWKLCGFLLLMQHTSLF